MVWRAMMTTLILLIAVPAGAQGGGDLAGRWAVMVDERVLTIIELERDPQAPSGWRGAVVRPDSMAISSSHSVFNISGPVVRRAILSMTTRPDGADLVVEGRPNEPPTHYALRLIHADHAELGLQPPVVPPIPLVRTDATAAVALQWEAGRSYQIGTPLPTNAEVTALFESDQAARRNSAVDWSVVRHEDAARRARVRELLDQGELRSGTDFFHAAFIFQHGGEADSYLFAHALAVIAAARGRRDAAWIAAATLDRYLQSIGQPQIYGTQYSTPRGQPATQEPYRRDFLSDALREAAGVPNLAGQEMQRQDFERREREREARNPPRP